uniref:Uncharacterized protein n=1 Tax=Anopheles funestus TaxID=62324 RepID=A0A4Y0BIC0_ANOFN
MAYLSDVDLATLHKSRLEERVQYRLSAMWTHAAEQSREQSLAVSSSTASPPAMFGDRETANYRAASTASTDRTSVDGTARLETHPNLVI